MTIPIVPRRWPLISRWDFPGMAVVVVVLLTATPLAWPAEHPTRSTPVVREDSLRATRWNIASYLYLLHYGRYDQAKSEANLDYAAQLGFNAVRFNIWWHEIFPDAASLKSGGNWTAPVTPRTNDPTSATHVKLSTLLDLQGWQFRERYFDPAFRQGRSQVEVLIDRDFTDSLLPIIPPQDYGNGDVLRTSSAPVALP